MRRSYSPETRCQHVIPSRGQCHLEKVDGGEYCPAHGGTPVLTAAKRKRVELLKTGRYRARMTEILDNESFVAVHDEIALLRVMLEDLVNTGDALVYSQGPISDLIDKIGRAVALCHKLDISQGQLLHRDRLLSFADGVVDVVIKYIADPDIREAIASEITNLVDRDEETNE